ncbi:MAG: hypothetical protein K9H49_04610 [Bacteroidales bacterium]|nr:hypothetical protein [Bacteroidales bacterium]MCF8389097.1 hypothetical protein [Bacteroidales bacterium]
MYLFGGYYRESPLISSSNISELSARLSSIQLSLSHSLSNKFFIFVFLFFSFPNLLFSQSQVEESEVLISFAKKSVILPQSSTFFNVVIIENKGSEVLSGTVVFNKPSPWSFIGSPEFDVSIEPGKKEYYPVRVGIPRNTIGGVSFIVQVELLTKTSTYSTISYVSIEKNSHWDMKVLNTNLYLSDFRPVGDFDLKLENTGNSKEMIKLNFDIGQLLQFKTFIEADSILFIELPAYSDTTIKFEVFRRKDLSYAEIRTQITNWKSTSIYIEASTPYYKTYAGLRVIPLESKIINDTPIRNSPLNVDMTLYNLLSFQKPKAALKLHGKLIFPENQQLQYSFGINSLYFNKDLYQNFDLAQQMRYMVRYNDSKTQVMLGDRLGVGSLHTMSGNALKAQHSLDANQLVSLNLVQNPYGSSFGSFLGYRTRIGRTGVNTGVTLESANRSNANYYTFHLGGTYNFLKHHTLQLQTATSLNNFSKGAFLQNDTTTIGFAYRASYHYSNEKFKFRIDNTNTTFTQLKNSGRNFINTDLYYQINSKSRFLGRYYRSSYLSNLYPYSFYFSGNSSRNENGRLLYSYSDGKMVYNMGAQFSGAMRNSYNQATDFSTKYTNYQPGLIGSVTFRLGGMRNITPNIAINSMYFNYNTNIEGDEPYSISGRLHYTVGLSYFDQAFRINAYYSSGDASEIYRSAVSDEEPAIGQAVQIRPSYERYFKDDKIRLNVYYNYSYFIPSLRENTVLNITSNFMMDKGWSVYGSLNLFKNSRNDNDYGRVITRDLNLMLGFRKAFDIQQPGMKYYNVAVIGFNDQDGDGVKDDDEKPVSNVLINLKRDPKKNKEDKALFQETKLVTDPNGEIFYGKMPGGVYDLEITPLTNLEDLFFLDGRNQQMTSDEDKIHYLPLVESYKVRGKIIVDRDPNSTHGRINLEGIRVSGTAENGSSYSTLTNSNGQYVLNLPKANIYTIKIYNVFGETFMLQKGEFEVQFMEDKALNIDFQFTEQKREIKFKEGQQLFDFQIDKK